MKKQIGIFLSGAVTIVPLAITAYVLVRVALWLDWMGTEVVKYFWGKDTELFPGAGAMLLIGAVYLVGLLMRVLAFRHLWDWVEGLIVKLPGVKVVYEMFRDMMKLLGDGSQSMGRVVEYRPPGSQGVGMLGILTNENPAGASNDPAAKRVAVYLPMAYMLGGPTVFASPEHLKDVNMSVEHALRMAATAHVGSHPSPASAQTRKED